MIVPRSYPALPVAGRIYLLNQSAKGWVDWSCMGINDLYDLAFSLGVRLRYGQTCLSPLDVAVHTVTGGWLPT